MDDFLTGKYNIEVYDNIIYCVYVQAFSVKVVGKCYE